MEKRNQERLDAQVYIGVKRQHDGMRLGHVIDISATGFAMVAKTRLEPGARLSLRLETETEPDLRQFIEVQAVCIRCEARKKVDLFTIGFSYLELSPKAKLRIRNLVQLLHGRG